MSEHEPQWYEGRAFTPSIAKEYLLNLYEGKNPFKINDIVEQVFKHHVELGGVDGNQTRRVVIEKALGNMQRADNQRAVCLDKLFWRILPDNQQEEEFVQSWHEVPREEEFGEGEEAVYLVYFDHHKRIAELNPTEYGTVEGKYPCKIGLTSKGDEYVKRLQDQFKLSWHSSFTIGIVYRTDRAKTVERYVHSQLDIRNREYPVQGEGGTEWFLTDTPEVFEIIKEVEPLLTEKPTRIPPRKIQ